MRFIWICILAYLLGNISSAYIVGKLMGGGIDIRKHGSGNAGATNTLRVLGKKAGILTLVGDLTKGLVAVLIGRVFLGDNGAIGAAVCVILGHIYPAFLGFKGGKGVATALGATLMVQPVATLICLAIGLGLIAIKKYVSLGAMVGISCFAPIMIIMKKPMIFVLYGVFIAGLVIYAHRANVKRLCSGKESKLGEK